MSRRRAPERLAQADLPRPLADHHQHDVHDDDAADHERQRDDADQHGEDARWSPCGRSEQRVGREHPEVVRSFGRSRRSIAQRHVASSIAALTSSGDFGLTSSCMPEHAAPNIFWKCRSG
jgi:hypothetical protein